MDEFIKKCMQFVLSIFLILTINFVVFFIFSLVVLSQIFTNWISGNDSRVHSWIRFYCRSIKDMKRMILWE